MLLTMMIVIAVAYFSMQVERTDYELLRQRVLVLQNEKNLSDSFRVAMNDVVNELTKFDDKKEPVIVTKQRVQLKIAKMNDIIKDLPEQQSANEKTFYDLIIQSVADLNDSKTKIRNLEDQKN